ncbi:MAG: hypothetical protein JXQ75_14815 [Phycisphaerae bacterium]|nr:hypothetical protein [Phycisphaerae bacterium]
MRRYAVLSVLVGGVLVLHWRVASRRASNLLEHDEAISLLAAAGKAQQVGVLYAGLHEVQVFPASDLQDLLRPTGDVTARDVMRSLSRHDRHPPLYFLILHGLGKWGWGIGDWGSTHGTAGPSAVVNHQSSIASRPSTVLRLFGTLVFFITAWVAHRWVWPDASAVAKLLGAVWLLATPAMVDIATELRQYALVYMGVMISVAALVMFWEETSRVRSTVILLVLAPVILVCSQYGTTVWVAICFLVAVACLLVGGRRRWRMLACSVVAATLTLVPLLLLGVRGISGSARSPSIPADGVYARAIEPVCSNLAEAWCSLPWCWRDAGALPMIAVLLLGVSAILAWRGGRAIDRVLWCAALSWGVLWLLLLATGWIPPHALEPKQLGPLVLVPACLIVRASSQSRPRWVRRTAVGVLAVSLATHGLGIWQVLMQAANEPLLTALQRAECLLVNAPKRGYLLPLVEKLRPDARVVIAEPDVATAHWMELSEILPDGGLVLAEIDSFHGDRRAPAAQEVFDRLSRTYRDATTLRKGPRRTVTEFTRTPSGISDQPESPAAEN